MNFPPNFKEPPPGYNNSNTNWTFPVDFSVPPPNFPINQTLTSVPPPPPTLSWRHLSPPPSTYRSASTSSTSFKRGGYNNNHNNQNSKSEANPRGKRSFSMVDDRTNRDNRAYERDRGASRNSSFSSVNVNGNRSSSSYNNKPETEREKLLENWRSNFCETSNDIAQKLAQLTDEKDIWIRSSPAENYYKRTTGNVVETTQRLDALCNLFEETLLKRTDIARENQTPYSYRVPKRHSKICKHKCKNDVFIMKQFLKFDVK